MSDVDNPAQAPAAPVIQTRELTKRYGDLTAVDRLDLEVQHGEIFGLLGPNGAGKTTTILMLLGLTEPTSGQALVSGHDSTLEPLAVKRTVGYLPDNVGFYDDLTARENLRYTAALNAIPKQEAESRIDALLGRVGLADEADRRTGEYSRGMRQRLGIADVLVKQPTVVVLDEPVVGLDPEGMAYVLDLVVRLSREDKVTVLVSSHLLHQVQQICDRVGIFVDGRMVAVGAVETLGEQLRGGRDLSVELEVEAPLDGLIAQLEQVEAVTRVERQDKQLLVKCSRDVRPELAKRVVEAGGRLLHLRMQEYGLQEIYLRYFREESA